MNYIFDVLVGGAIADFIAVCDLNRIHQACLHRVDCPAVLWHSGVNRAPPKAISQLAFVRLVFRSPRFAIIVMVPVRARCSSIVPRKGVNGAFQFARSVHARTCRHQSNALAAGGQMGASVLCATTQLLRLIVAIFIVASNVSLMILCRGQRLFLRMRYLRTKEQ